MSQFISTTLSQKLLISLYILSSNMKDTLASLMKKKRKNNPKFYSPLNISMNLETLLRMIPNLNTVTTVRILMEVSWASVSSLSL